MRERAGSRQPFCSMSLLLANWVNFRPNPQLKNPRMDYYEMNVEYLYRHTCWRNPEIFVSENLVVFEKARTMQIHLHQILSSQKASSSD